jgi:hypothetical protein
MKVKPVRVVVLRGLGFSFDDPGKSPTGDTITPRATNAIWHEDVPPADPENDVREEMKEVDEKASILSEEDGVPAAENADPDSGVPD